VAVTLAVALVWLLGRSSVLRRERSLPDASAPGAACVTSIALSLLALVLVFTNPFAALLLVPAVHFWMLGTLTDVRWRGGLVLFAAGLLPIVCVVLYYLWRLQLGPVDGAWYLFLLVTGNQTGVFTTACLVTLAALAGSVVSILWARARHGEPVGPRGGGGGSGRGRRGRQAEPQPSIFGPGGHAGPGARHAGRQRADHDLVHRVRVPRLVRGHDRVAVAAERALHVEPACPHVRHGALEPRARLVAAARAARDQQGERDGTGPRTPLERFEQLLGVGGAVRDDERPRLPSHGWPPRVVRPTEELTPARLAAA
jgi:hypothetical protein